MLESTTYVGLDAHKDSISVGAALSVKEVLDVGKIANTSKAVADMADRLARRYGKLSFVYEAGPCGYGLYRQLVAMGHQCMVTAPSLIPRRSGDRVKTDRRDAASLASLLRAGQLTAVWVPDEHHEAIRDLVRCREDIKQAERRCRQRMCGFLLRQGRLYDGSHWTLAHRRWLQSQRFDRAAHQVVFDHYLQAIIEAETRVGTLEQEMLAALEGWSLRPLVKAYLAMRGVKLVTAMTLAAELGDLTRFTRAQQVMAYVGLVPAEDSSGPRRRLLGITKSGNGHVRRVLVESAWAYRHKPAWSPAHRRRASDASEAVRTIAWKAQQRLHKRYHRLIQRGKTPQTAITAVAREEIGFFWAISQQVAREQQSTVPMVAGRDANQSTVPVKGT